jgi:hypothetical protein
MTMAGVTVPLGFPYPTGTDRVADGDNAMQAMAEAIDNYLAPLTGVIITPPALNGWNVAATKLFRMGIMAFLSLDGAKAGWPAGESLCQLPVGYRPTTNTFQPAVVGATGAIQTVYVNNAGFLVSVQAQAAGGSLYCTMCWPVAPGTATARPGDPDAPDVDNALPDTPEPKTRRKE